MENSEQENGIIKSKNCLKISLPAAGRMDCEIKKGEGGWLLEASFKKAQVALG
jgi:hypothetical protein